MANRALRTDSEQTRRQILESARELCREAGYEHIRMVDIAERVGCARATVYNHFANRDELLEALCTEYLEGYLLICDRIRAWATPHNTVFEVLRETVAEELRWRVAHAELRGALDSAKRLRKEFYVRGDRRIDDAMVAWFDAIYAASAERGLIRDGVHLPFATRAVYALLDHVVADFPVETSPDEVARVADEVARLQWHALYGCEPEDAPLIATLPVDLWRARGADHAAAAHESGTSSRRRRKAASRSTVDSSPAAATT